MLLRYSGIHSIGNFLLWDPEIDAIADTLQYFFIKIYFIFRDKFPPIQQGPRQQDDIVLNPVQGKNSQSPATNSTATPAIVANGNEVHTNGIDKNDNLVTENIEKHEMNGLLEIPEAENEVDEISHSSEMDTSNSEKDVSQNNEIPRSEEYNGNSEEKINDEPEGAIDDVLNEVLKENGENTTGIEEDSIIDSILSNDEEHFANNSESVDER